MNVNKLVRNLGKTLAGRPKTRKSSNNNNNKRRNRRRRNTRINRALPAAYTSHVRARFTILSRNSNRCVVSGCDLVYSIPAELSTSGDTIFTVIPCNPAYWIGTRIARIAPAYQNYRPLQFKCSYIPQVAVTQAGTVFMGTLWNQSVPSENIQQSLVTSNGGQLTQCYIPADSNVTLGRNLQQNLFKTTGALCTDTNPFIFLAGVRGASVVPGYFYVTYRYEFKNPIGDAWTFINSGLSTVGSLPEQESTANGTLVLLNQNGSLGPGTQLDRESDGIYYNGSPITLDDQVQVVYLNNFQTALQTKASRSLDLSPIPITGFYLNPTYYQFTSFSTVSGGGGSIVPPSGKMLVVLSDDNQYFTLRFTTTAVSLEATSRYTVIDIPSTELWVTLRNGESSVFSYDGDKMTDDTSQVLFLYKTYYIVRV